MPLNELKKTDFQNCKTTIGQGSYAIIQKGFYNNNTVAIKVSEGELGRKSVTDEIEILKIIHQHCDKNSYATINKHYILTYFGYCNTPSQSMLLTEYAPYGNLHRWICRSYGDKWDMAYAFLSDISKGIAFLHKMNIIHGDIKAANVLLFKENRATAKLCDFGFAKVEDDNKAYQGTPQYLAPEVLNKQFPISKKSDIFSFATVMWEVLMLQPIYADISNLNYLAKFIADGNRAFMPDTIPKITVLIKLGWLGDKDKRPDISLYVNELATDINELSETLQTNKNMFDALDYEETKKIMRLPG